MTMFRKNTLQTLNYSALPPKNMFKSVSKGVKIHKNEN